MKNKVSPETEIQAMKTAKSIQKPGQTKEQTKLISQGIEKGIAEFKKQHSKKVRELDKQRKKKLKQRESEHSETVHQEVTSISKLTHYLPWVLLGLSWLGFVIYVVT